MNKKHSELDLEKYRGEWVALEPKTRHVLGHGSTLAAAERQALERGVKKPLLMPVPRSNGFFIGRGNPLNPPCQGEVISLGWYN